MSPEDPKFTWLYAIIDNPIIIGARFQINVAIERQPVLKKICGFGRRRKKG